QKRIALPPVDAHLPGLVRRRDEQTQLDGQELDVEQVDLNVPGDDDAFVEHALEHICELGRLTTRDRRLRILTCAAKWAAHRSSSTCERRYRRRRSNRTRSPSSSSTTSYEDRMSVVSGIRRIS